MLQLLYWVYRPIQLLNRCQRLYGDSFSIRFPGRHSFVFTSDPAIVQGVFSARPERLFAGKANLILKPLLGPNSLLLMDGMRHSRERKLLMPAFHGEQMRSYGPLLVEIIDRTLDRAPRNQSFSIHPLLQSIALETILRVLLGTGRQEVFDRMKRVLIDLLACSSSPFMIFLGGMMGDKMKDWPAWIRFPSYNLFVRLLREMDELLLEEIQQRRRSPDQFQDGLTSLMQAADEKGRKLSDRELRDEMMTLLVAGHETTATALAWSLWRLISCPRVLQTLSHNLESCNGSCFRWEEVMRLDFLDAVIKETLRLNPVIPLVGRELACSMTLGSRQIPAGTVVAPCIFLAHRRPDLWRDPEQFRPERFLEGNPRPYEFFPFGGGARYCLGAGFALLEMKLVLARILSRFHLEAQPGYRARIVRRGVTLAPSQGVLIRLIPH